MRIINRLKLEIKELLLQIKHFTVTRRAKKVFELLDMAGSSSTYSQLETLHTNLLDKAEELLKERKRVREQITQLKINKLVKKYQK